jgi:hypothetical protein
MPRGYPGIVVTPKEASKRWRERNPGKVTQANRRPRHRLYDAAMSKSWREKRLASPEYREQIKRQCNARATAIRRWLDQYKILHGCIDCGYKEHHAALHFDHVDGIKAMNVCNAKSVAQAKREIAKCVVRCANYHAVKTFKFYPCKPDIFEATYEAVEEVKHA